MTEISGEHVRLRPVSFDDIETLVTGYAGEDAPFAGTDAMRERLRRQIERSPTLADDGFVAFAVEHDNILVGDIQARCPKHGFPPGVCEIGITLFPSARGKGAGKEAVALLTDHLLGEGQERVQATTDVANVAMRSVLEAVGYTFEGILASYAPSDDDGGRADYAMYAVVAPDRG